MYSLDLREARWHTSTHSSANANCVEVARLSGVEWRTSTHSTDNANCVEVAFAGPAVVVRDSKNANGPILAFPAPGWAGFLARHTR